MRVDRYATAAEFLQAAGPFLRNNELENNLMLGIAGSLVTGDHGAISDAIFAVVSDDEPLLAALQTPSHNLVLSDSPSVDAVEQLADVFAAAGCQLPGVIGPAYQARTFSKRWALRTNATITIRMSERFYTCTSVIQTPQPEGQSRLASVNELPLLAAWFMAFRDEALPHEDVPVGGYEPHILRTLDSDGSGFLLWENGVVVSMAGFRPITENGYRVGPVHTPEDKRGHGYASALTADLTRQLLVRGATYVCLFTDRANTTSNKIYQSIGYEPVMDVLDVVFSKSE